MIVTLNILVIFQLIFMSAVFLVSLAASEEERSRVDQVRGKILSWYAVGSEFM